MRRYRCLFFCSAIIVLSILFSPMVPADADVLVFPSAIVTIQESAFENDKSLGIVNIPEGCRTIRKNAFYNSSITEVYLPSTITYIHSSAFGKCSNICVHGVKNSYVESWCRENNIAFVAYGSQPKDSVKVQDPRFFMPDFSYGDAEYKEGYDKTMLRFSGKISDRGILLDYISRLCDGMNNFSLNHEYASMDKYFSWSLRYIGTAEITTQIPQQYANSYSGEMTLYTIDSGSEFSGYIQIAGGLEFEDLGLRAGGDDVTVSGGPGQSAQASLYESGGTYYTDDGRFAVKAGDAQIWTDGTRHSGKVSGICKEKAGKLEFLVNGYQNGDCLALMLPLGDVGSVLRSYSSKSLGLSSSASYTISSQQGFFSYTWKRALGSCHNGKYLMLHYPSKNAFKEGYVRIMKWDEDADIGVIYIAAAFSSAPYEVDCLFAIHPSLISDGEDTKQYVNVAKGATKALSGPAGEYEEFNKTWNWEIVSGERIVSLSSYIGQRITVRGLKGGTAVVRVTYDRSYYYEDALTGIQRTGRMATTQDYVITVK